MKNTFTIDEIKKAYWEEYHEAGEIYFDHLGTPEENEKDTLDKWNCFLEALEEIERKGK
jgi:hypothetical protein